jgi:hypothetical protein
MRAKGLAAMAGAALAAAALVTSAGAAGKNQTGLRLSSRAEVNAYLLSIGIDPSTVVVQRGRRNYAGPNCPGKRWKCTKAQRVFQVSTQDENVFECTPAGPGTNAATNTCVIVQASTAGTNSAVCRMQDTGTDVTQSCSITQTNSTGTNHAIVDLLARGRGGTSQTATQNVTIDQSNGSGTNDIRSLQRVDHFVTDATTGNQTQEAHQTFDGGQTSSTGPNTLQAKQFQLVRGTASGHGAVTQRQNAASGGPNQDIELDQTSVSGANTSLTDQGIELKLLATSPEGPVTQVQGSPSGGISATVDQSSSARSKSSDFQDEDVIAHASTSGTLIQTQFGPLDCCTDQLGNGNNVFDINQESRLFSDHGTQSSQILGTCTTSGSCTIDQLQQTDAETITNSDSCTGSVVSPCSVTTAIVCVPGEGCTAGPPGDGGLESRRLHGRSGRGQG